MFNVPPQYSKIADWLTALAFGIVFGVLFFVGFFD